MNHKEIEERAFKQVHMLYGNTLDDQIKERLEKELHLVKDKGFDIYFWIAMKIVDYNKKQGYSVIARGSIGSSFLAYLLGITQVNPLKSHYICVKCKRVEFVDDFESGIDLPLKKCPCCETEMVSLGENLPIETFLGYDGSKAPNFNIDVSKKLYEDTLQYVSTLISKHKLVRLITEETVYGKKQETTHPWKVIFVPEEINEKTLTAKLCESLVNSSICFGIGKSIVLDILKELELKTLVPMDRININDKRLFDEYWKCDLEKIAVFTKEIAWDSMLKIAPNSFSDIIILSGLMRSLGAYHNNAEVLLGYKIANLSEIVSSTDSLLNYLMNKAQKYKFSPLAKKDCYDITELVKDGKAKKDIGRYIKSLQIIDIPNWYIESLKKISYIAPKAHAIEYEIYRLRTIWYKTYYPKEFFEVYSKI